MATIALANTNTSSQRPTRQNQPVPYRIENEVNFATAVTTKGSAIAQSDVITAIAVPKESVILAAGFEVIAAMTGTSTDATLDMGVTGGDVDNFVDGFDLDAGAVGDYSAQPVAYAPVMIGNTADTIDLLIVTQTGTILTGRLRCWALVMDIADQAAPGIAQLGS